jgi:polycystin 1L2
MSIKKHEGHHFVIKLATDLSVLSDNDFLDTYFYMISVQTGLRVGSGTSSNISFILGGSDADTGVRNLTK